MMRFAWIVLLVSVPASFACGCAQLGIYGSAADPSTLAGSGPYPLDHERNCARVPYPQCGGGGG